jgi:hypothetical protein
MTRVIFDADECSAGPNCPKFVIDEKTKVVSMIDKKGKKVDMTVGEFNKFVDAVLSNEIKRL